MIEFDVVITNGYVERDTIYNMVDKGWNFVATIPAQNVHSHALNTDKATIFTKFTEPEKPDEDEMPVAANNALDERLDHLLLSLTDAEREGLADKLSGQDTA